MAKGSGYDQVRQIDSKDYAKTVNARLDSIRSHFTQAPRAGKLNNKVCIITGVGSLKGIGRASALLFAHEGAKHLYLIDFDPTNLSNLKETIETKYPDVKATTLQADASDEAAILGVCNQALEEEGRLDVFFANAGIASMKHVSQITTEDFMNTIKVNSLSCFLAVKYASAAMKKTNPSKGKQVSSGSIILTASVAGIRSGAGPVDYSASKAAVNSIAKTSSYQLQKTDIRVNSVCPGLIETAMTTTTFDFARGKGTDSKLGQLSALGRYAIAEEIAPLAVYLASDDSSYVNGQNIAIDGGLSASVPVVPGRWT
ncbi:NAD(P)-binding protein [Guyanagaster necrorhizus]|uniref:NAD(P)-binding protein n=1 Tax=Guyanagaster necrorhizus TaxID=856835 RepID=A0A9P8AWR6_9AGAR|nr:NAD(P)-binding protein [Guyanagaster necrorhizus MCA 3950]KAG7450964.1 NAD(P)-binding protein [Guyanagaster necrorhizus MCA 3950]